MKHQEDSRSILVCLVFFDPKSYRHPNRFFSASQGIRSSWNHKVDQPKTAWNNQERNKNIDEEENIQSIADIVLQHMDTSSKMMTSTTTWENDGKMQGFWRSWGSWPLGFRRYAAEDPPWKILKEPDLRSFLKARERWGGNYEGPLGTSRDL